MSQATESGVVPEWTMGDRLGKSLHVAEISVAAMAEYLGLSRNSVSAYINDRQQVRRQTLLLWSMRTGVPLVWIETGEGPTDSPDGPAGVVNKRYPLTLATAS